MVTRRVLVQAGCFHEPLPINIVDRCERPFVFCLEVFLKVWNQGGIAICSVVLLVDGAGRGEDHAKAIRKEWRKVDTKGMSLQEFFGAKFEVGDLLCKVKAGRELIVVVCFFKGHEGLPGDWNIVIRRLVPECPSPV